MARRRVATVAVCASVLITLLVVAISPPAGAQERAGEGAGEITVTERIINGSPVPIDDAPWQVALIEILDDGDPSTADGFFPFCGGSIVDRWWVVTAAHCLDPPAGSTLPPRGPDDFGVLLGVDDLTDVTTDDVYDVVSVSQHPEWNPTTDENDIAVLRLEEPIDFDMSAADPIALPWWQDPGSWPAAGAPSTISGWGVTGVGQQFGPDRLQLAVVDVLAGPTDPCGRDLLGYRGSSMLCAADLDANIDTCFGDSGGPLAAIGNGVPTLAGITSFGIGCANGVDPGVYARVTNYLSWIDSLTGLAPDGWTASIVGVQPARLYDSRPSFRTTDGLQQTSQRVAAGTVVEVDVAGRGGVDIDAVSALVNVVAVRPQEAGFLTLFPCVASPQPPEGRPESSTLNYGAGEVVANGALVHLGVGGTICVYAHRTTDLVLDVTGFIPRGAAGVGLRPARLLETRFGAPTIDGVPATVGGQPIGRGLIPGGFTIEVQVAGRAGVPLDATEAWVNVAAVNPFAQGFVTLFPCGSARPAASTLNYRPGEVVANGALVRLGVGGTVCLYTHQTTDLILDVAGFLPSGSPVSGLVPARLLETRSTGSTIDGLRAGVGRLAAGTVLEIPVAGRAGVPRTAAAAMVNVAAIGASAAGFITLYPCDQPRPDASTLNFAAGEVVANSAFVPLGGDGSICLYAHQSVDAILDVTAWAPA